jgi:hypothetical protein
LEVDLPTAGGMAGIDRGLEGGGIQGGPIALGTMREDILPDVGRGPRSGT